MKPMPKVAMSIIFLNSATLKLYRYGMGRMRIDRSVRMLYTPVKIQNACRFPQCPG